jgi:hypothetical protein
MSENPTGTLSVQCHKCQFSGYAKAGTKAARTLRASMKPDDDAPAVVPAAKAPPPELPAARAIPDPKPKAAAVKAAPGFAFGGL